MKTQAVCVRYQSVGRPVYDTGTSLVSGSRLVYWQPEGTLNVFAPQMMALMSPVQDIVELGAQCLRIEAWAEPLYGAAIVCYGVMVGAGDTLVPSLMNLGSMWIVRITLASILVTSMGLPGVWTAMCIELCVRGTIFLIRLWSGQWSKKISLSNS